MRSKALAFILLLVGGLLAGPVVVMGMMGPGSRMGAGGEQGRCPCPGMGHGKMHTMGMGGHHEMGHGRMFHQWDDFLFTHKQELGVTDEQLDKVDSIFAAHTKDAIRKNAERKILRMEVRDLLLKEKIDLVEVEQKLRALEALVTNLSMDGVRALDEALNTLTPEQRKKALALFKERARPAGMRMMRGPMRMGGHAAMTERMRCVMGPVMMGE